MWPRLAQRQQRDHRRRGNPRGPHRSTPEELVGMRLRRFMVLSYLSERDGLPQQELGEFLNIDANNLVLLLNELEAEGLAERPRDPEDR